MTDAPSEHEGVRVDLAGYVLGNLTLAEQQTVEAHLEGCADCRAELVGIEGIPVLLELARTVPAAAAPGAREVATPSRSRRGALLVGAAGVLAIAAALVVGVLIGQPDRPDFGPSIGLRPVATAAGPTPGSGPTGTAALRATDNGTEVRLDLAGLPVDGHWYECTWSSGQGEQSAGTFRPADDGTVQIDLTTAARLYPGWRLAIVEHDEGQVDVPADGEVVLEASA